MSDSKSANSPGRHKRWWLWIPLLGVGGWLAAFGDKAPALGSSPSLPTRVPPPVRAAAAPLAGAHGPTSAPPPDALVALVPRATLIASAGPTAAAEDRAQRDLFSARNWNPPPPPPPAPTPAPAPVAPPLPFSFLGKKFESDAWEVYLARGEETFIAREGQVLAGMYRVDKIAPPALALTYLPLGQSQEMPIGDSR